MEHGSHILCSEPRLLAGPALFPAVLGKWESYLGCVLYWLETKWGRRCHNFPIITLLSTSWPPFIICSALAVVRSFFMGCECCWRPLAVLVGTQWEDMQAHSPCVSRGLHVTALLTSPFPAWGTFPSHNRKTTISVPFFFSRPEEKGINTGKWKAQMRAVCPDREGYYRARAALQGTNATQDGFSPGVCASERQLTQLNWAGHRFCICSLSPGLYFKVSLFWDLFNLGLESYSFMKKANTWYLRQKIQNRRFWQTTAVCLITRVHIPLYSLCHCRSGFFGYEWDWI